MNKGFVIAIDGPPASGKGTIVQMVTNYFNGINIYTGGMYRALGLKCINENISLEDEEHILKVFEDSLIDIGEDESLGAIASIHLDGNDITAEIKMPNVGIAAGKVALFGKVREKMARRQFEIADKFVNKGRVVVMDGQDTALIYKEAKLKIFLTANQEIRSNRRLRQYEKAGVNKTQEEVLREIKDRDNRDSNRILNPLSRDPQKDGYFLLDSTSMDENETFKVIIEELKKRGLTND